MEQERINIIKDYLIIDCKDYNSDLILLNDLRRNVVENLDIELKGIFVDLRNQYDICSSIIGYIARFFKQKKKIVLLVDFRSHVNDVLNILGFDKLARIFYTEIEYKKYTENLINKEE